MDQFHESIRRDRMVRDLNLKGVDLLRIQLSGLRADNLDLAEADLREAALGDIKWSGCILRDALLQEAECTRAVLRLCDLDEARVYSPYKTRARLKTGTFEGHARGILGRRGRSLGDFERESRVTRWNVIAM